MKIQRLETFCNEYVGFVRVATRALERVPSLSWQEQLPPLTAPLTAIALPPRPEAAFDDGAQQQ